MRLLGTPHCIKWPRRLYKQPDPDPPQFQPTQKLKMKLASFLATTALADPFQFNVHGTVYEGYFSNDLMNYWETKAHCDAMGGGWQLPTPTNSYENQAAFKIAQGRGNIFLGIAQYENEDADVSSTWFNLYTGEATGYTTWHRGQPNNFRGNEDFAVMLRYVFELKNFRVTLLSNAHTFLLQRLIFLSFHVKSDINC